MVLSEQLPSNGDKGNTHGVGGWRNCIAKIIVYLNDNIYSTQLYLQLERSTSISLTEKYA